MGLMHVTDGWLCWVREVPARAFVNQTSHLLQFAGPVEGPLV